MLPDAIHRSPGGGEPELTQLALLPPYSLDAVGLAGAVLALIKSLGI